MSTPWFDISHLNSFFQHTFKLELPANLKPEPISADTLNFSDAERKAFVAAKAILDGKWFRRPAENKKLLPESAVLSPEDEERVAPYREAYQQLRTRNELITRLLPKREMGASQIESLKKIIPHSKRILLYWLANAAGIAHHARGLTVTGLKQLPESVFQLGQEDSNTKGYFTYTSTSLRRRVRIRFLLWNQYDPGMERNAKRLASIQQFFADFEHFEAAAREHIATLFLFYDEMTETAVDITLKNGKNITKDRGFGRRIINNSLFADLLAEIEA